MVRQNVANGEFYDAKKPIKVCAVNVDTIVISKLVEIKSNSKFMIGYLDEVITALVLMLPKMSGYVKTFKKVGIRIKIVN